MDNISLSNHEYSEPSIVQLLNELDKIAIQDDVTHDNDTFMLPIQIVHNIQGVGVAVIGKAINGVINAGDNVELLGLQPISQTLLAKIKGTKLETKKGSQAKKVDNMSMIDNHGKAASLKLFDHPIKVGKKRDYLGIAVHSNMKPKDVKRGMMVVKQPNNNKSKIKAFWRFTCSINFISASSNDDNMGRKQAISVGIQPVFHFLTNDVTGEIDTIPSQYNGVIEPGTNVDNITVHLKQSAVIWKDLKFIVREGGKTIGTGIIMDVNDE